MTLRALVATMLAAGMACPSAAALSSEPLAPGEALASFELEPGLEIAIVAAEPEVVDPVAMAFDRFGRMFVAENVGYPSGGGDDEPGMGRIARLEDRDGDGRFETRTTFADGLTFPNGVLPWGDGIFVTCAPDLLFLEDGDGDGRAERREVVLTGFGLGGSTQLRANDPTLAPDGWIHVAGGLGGGSVRSLRDPDSPAVDAGRGDVRFDPVTGRIESVDGRSQYGHTFDAAGRRFICMNRIQAQHVVLESRHLARNPHLPFARTVEDLPEGRIDDLLHGRNAAARIFPLSANLTTADSHAGTFSAACSVTFWAGGRLPNRYDGGVFSCEPTGNLVHWDRLEPNGATFRALRAEGETEFLRSRDDWFRPVFLADGPDGALHVCDMYRRTIEHPDYLPEEIRRRTDFTSGRDRGRIYRILAAAEREKEERGQTADRERGPVHVPGPNPRPEDLVARLINPHRWQRESAHGLLLQEGIAAARPALRGLVVDRHEGRAGAEGTVRALHLLDRFDALPDDLLVVALRHPEPDVLVAALRLTENRAKASAPLREQAVALGRHADAQVRFQAALVMGGLADEERTEALATIALQCPGDRWTRAAVLSGVTGVELSFWRELLEAAVRMKEDTKDVAELLHESAVVVGRAGSGMHAMAAAIDALHPALDRSVAESARRAGMAAATMGLLDGNVSRSGRDQVLSSFRDRFGPDLDWLSALAADPEVGEFARIQAARLAIALGDPVELAGFWPLAGPRASVNVQRAVAREIIARMDPGTIGTIFEESVWSSLGTAAQSAAITGLVERPECHAILLDAVGAGRFPAVLVQPADRARLAESDDADVVRRAGTLFTSAAGSDRLRVYEDWKEVASLEGDAALGQDVFARLCASCHRLDQVGSHVGPDLFGIRNQPKEAILLHIVVPNHEVMEGFQTALVTCRDGRILSGIVTAETEASLTLRQALGIDQTIVRAEIDRIELLPASLMPDGLEAATSREEMAALLAFLKGEGRVE